MLKLKRRVFVNKKNVSFLTKESKQVGKIYHVCNLEDLSEYIVSGDTLSSSGNYRNWMLGGRSDVISFTREKSYVVNTEKIRSSHVLFDFEVNGDLLSEKHKILPYNDLAYNDSGKFDSEGALDTPENLEHEEVVIGTIQEFSKYVYSVRFSVNLFGSLSRIVPRVTKDLDSVVSYMSKFKLTNDLKLYPRSSNNTPNMIPYPSFDSFVASFSILGKMVQGTDVDFAEVKKAFKYFSQDNLDTLLMWESIGSLTENKKYLIRCLLSVGANPKYLSSKMNDLDFLLEIGYGLSDREKLKRIIPLLTWDMVKHFIPVEYFRKKYIGKLSDEFYSLPHLCSTEQLLSYFENIKLSSDEKKNLIDIMSKLKDYEIDTLLKNGFSLDDSDFETPINYGKFINCILVLHNFYTNTLLKNHSDDLATMHFNKTIKNNPDDIVKFVIIDPGYNYGKKLYDLLSKDIIPKNDLDKILLSLFTQP